MSAARVLADILQRLLGHAQDDRLLRSSSRPAGGAVSSVVIVEARSASRMWSTASTIAPSRPELVEQRRPELADERPDVAELAAEQLAQEAQLGPGEARVGVDDALDVLDLEDRVR